MKFSGHYSPDEQEALRAAVEAANARLEDLAKDQHFHVAYIELWVSEDGSAPYVIGADPTETELDL